MDQKKKHYDNIRTVNITNKFLLHLLHKRMATNHNLTLNPNLYPEIATQGKYKEPKMVARNHYPNRKQTI